MSLNTTLDITKVITTTLQSIDPSPTLATTFGVVSTQLGSATTSTIATTIGTGLIGNTGATGAEGDSAYTVWIKQGHVGTEQDFLDSLVSTVPGPAGTTDYLDLINKPFIPSNLSDLLPDSTHRVVTDAQIIAWDSIPTATNLSSTSDAVSVTVLSSTGTDTTIPAASSSLAGVATATQITKLNGIADGATANSSDATLLSRANHTGTQAQNTVDGLVDSLASKQPLSSVLTNTSASFTTALETKLNGVAPGAEVNVNPDWNAVSGDAQILNKPLSFTPSTHDNSAHSVAYASSSDVLDLSKLVDGLGSSGLISGCELSISQSNPTKFNMSSGVGVIIDNWTNPATPSRTIVNIPSQENISPTYLATDATSYLFVDRLGNLVFNNYGSTPEDRRELIFVGWIDHTDNLSITGVKVQPFSTTAAVSQLNDFFLSFGPFNISGNAYYAAGGLQVARSAGETFDSNANYSVNKQSPHILTTDIESPCGIYYYYRDNSGGWINGTEISSVVDPNHYDNKTGILEPVPSGKWTIQVIAFYAQTLATDVQYGQVVYDTFASAKSALQDAVDINPYNSYDTFRGWLIVKQGATDLSDVSQATFVAAGKFGLVDVASGGGTGGEINTASNIGASGIGIYRQKIGVDLQFKNIYATGALGIDENLSSNVITIHHTDTTSIRHVTDVEKALWNSKQAALGFTPVPDTRTISGKPLNGDITLLKGDVGLGNVDNTADASKPISTATQAALNGKEPSFTKNTAFNKNFGSSAGTVCEGNDSRLSDQRSPTTHSASHSSGGSDALSHNNLANLNVGEYKHLTAAEYSSNVYEAPVDNKQYARKNSAWVEVSTTAGSEQNMFIQNSPPVVTEGLPYLWVQTGIDGGSMTFWVEDGL